MAEESGTEPELQDCAVRYLASLGTTPEELARRYPNTYEEFAKLSCDQIDVLDRIGAALAEDDPKGDNHHKDADYADSSQDADYTDDPTQESADKLKKYLYVIH